jgi:hypothetical protein
MDADHDSMRHMRDVNIPLGLRCCVAAPGSWECAAAVGNALLGCIALLW